MNPMWQRKASSRIWLTASRSYTPRSCSRTTRVRGVGIEVLDMKQGSRAGAKNGDDGILAGRVCRSSQRGRPQFAGPAEFFRNRDYDGNGKCVVSGRKII